MKLNPFFAASAVLTGLVIPLHIFGGGPEFPGVIMASGLDALQSSMYMILWHAVTVVLTGCTLAYAAAAWSDRFTTAALFAAFQFLGFAGLFLVYGTIGLGTIWTLPQWVLFTAIVAVSAPGFFRRPARVPATA